VSLVRSARDRVLGWPPWALLVVVLALSRVVTALVIQASAVCCQNPAGVGHLRPGYADMAGLWDGAWYAQIAAGGYPLPLPVDGDNGQVTFSSWAFYPVFPLVVRAVTAFGVPFVAAAQLVNLTASVVAVMLVWRLLSSRADERTGPGDSRVYQRMAVLAAAVWCFYPATAVLQVAYSEAIAATLLAGSLLLLTHRRYLLATVLVLALGFTRGIAAPLGVVVVVHLYLRWREERASSRPWLHGQRTSALVLVAGTALSAVAWPVVVGLASGRLDAFFVIQARWGQEPGRGPFVAWVTWAWDRLGIVGVLVLLGLVASYVALVTGRHGRWLSVELRAWALAYPLFLLAVTRPITSMWRFLLLDFPLAAILVSITVRGADGLAVLPTWPRRLLLVCGSLLVGIGAWTVVLLTYTPWQDSPP